MEPPCTRSRGGARGVSAWRHPTRSPAIGRSEEVLGRTILVAATSALVAGVDPTAAGSAGIAAIGAPQSADCHRGDDGGGRGMKAAADWAAAAVFESVRSMTSGAAGDTAGVDASLPVGRVCDGGGGWFWADE
ncbi:hypothetical protein MMPV_006889 [Pyropia vietnamensis]